MKIVHIINHTGRFNGNVHAAVDLACAQVERGHQVTVASGKGHFDEVLAACGVSRAFIDQRRTPLRLIAALRGFERLIERERPDIVHAHMVTSALIASPICKLKNIPLVTTVHNAFKRSAIVMGIGDRVIAVSGAIGGSLARRGIRGDKIRVVLNGTIGVARRAVALPDPVMFQHPALLYVGGLNPRKGIADLLAAFDLIYARDSSCYLYLVGEGPNREEYEAASRQLNCCSNIIFCGSFSDPRGHMASADVFILPSHADPAPLVLSEAREAGCAIVATDVDGIPEMLESGQAGVLVPPQSPAALAESILAVISTDQALATWRENSQTNIQRMSIARVATETVDVYAECLSTKGRFGVKEAMVSTRRAECP